MTVAGIAVVDGVGWAWADAESYNHKNEPIDGDTLKLGVAEGELVIVAAGWQTIVAEVVNVAAQLKSGSASANLAVLMARAAELSARKRRYFAREGLDWSAMTRFGAVLLERGRLRGLIMHEAENFAPRPSAAWGSPGFARAPTCAADVEAIARGQLDIVRREIPRATGRALTIAKIGPRGVATTKIRLPSALV